MKVHKINEFIGKTVTNIFMDKHQIIFHFDNGEKYMMYHDQDCCEDVYIEDIDGDINLLIGQPLVVAEYVTTRNHNDVEKPASTDEGDSQTWTFYRLGNVNTFVVIRWYGTSNGYYSEEVTIEQC